MQEQIKTYFNNVFTLRPELKIQHENFLNKYLPMTSFYTVYYYVNSETISSMMKTCLRLKRYNHIISKQNRFMALLSCSDSMQVKKSCHLSDAGCPVSLSHSHRLNPQFMDTVARIPKGHKLILAYDTVMHWLIVMDTVTGQRIKQDVSQDNIQFNDFNYDKVYNPDNKMIALDRKELIKGLQATKEDYIYLQYNKDLKSYIFTAHNTTIKVKANEIQ
jgi:hypothetical protein